MVAIIQLVYVLCFGINQDRDVIEEDKNVLIWLRICIDVIY